MRQMPRTEAESHHWPILEPLSGNRERPVALNKPVCVAGDRARVNLPLPSETVSRSHALFLCDDHGVYVRDLASKNHLFLNDEPVREAHLNDGDRLAIGPYVFRCEDLGEHQNANAERAPASELKTADGSTEVPLTGRSAVIGRRDDCDVIIEGELVSPAHAVIFELDGRHCIRDLRSRHGTFVNDKRIGQSPLRHTDQIRIGDAVLIYQEAMEPAAPAEPSNLADTGEHQPIPGSAEPDLNIDEMPEAQPQPAAAPDGLDVIPLAGEPGELKAVAAEFAEERAGEDNPVAQDQTPDPGPSESGIIPLLDDSEGAPGLPHESKLPADEPSDSEIPIGFALDDDDEPVQSIAEPQPGRKTGPGSAPPGSARGKSAKDPDRRSRAKSGLKARP